MIGFALRRLAVSVPILILATFVVFVLVASSGDPLGGLRANPAISEATIRARERALNLDKPIPVRYGLWIGNAVQGDLGTSAVTNEDVFPLLVRRLGVTLRLVLVATAVAAVLAIAVGVVAAVKQYTPFDYTATGFAFLFFSVPVFWLAAVLKDVGIRINDAVGNTVFYTVGEQTPNLVGGFSEVWSNRLGHLILPALTLILIQLASWSRYQRATMLDVLHSDYIRTARAKGLGRFRVLTVHALRNALIPVVTVVAIDFAAIMGGAVLTETVFSWDGMGVLLVDGVRARDVNVVQGWLLVTAVVVIVFNLVADLLYGVLDPRIRRG